MEETQKIIDEHLAQETAPEKSTPETSEPEKEIETNPTHLAVTIGKNTEPVMVRTERAYILRTKLNVYLELMAVFDASPSALTKHDQAILGVLLQDPEIIFYFHEFGQLNPEYTQEDKKITLPETPKIIPVPNNIIVP